ncbi:unnamed protein product [Cuscuta epithymum]|uniref:Uncharacterized protein n=1 Tax=Cuscuta epithymum TaxID=186058 RepID=A0AAV0DAH9_9ASTE|nr:unnamed protein product [Cuscuta epithymum]CAH9118771.1 unnamed protein product [Cuscuta epithymum]
MAHNIAILFFLTTYLFMITTADMAANENKLHYYYGNSSSSSSNSDGAEEFRRFHRRIRRHIHPATISNSSSPPLPSPPPSSLPPSSSPLPSPSPSQSPFPSPSPSPPSNGFNTTSIHFERIVYRGLQTVPACNALRYGSCLGQALNVQRKCNLMNRSCIR